MTQFRTPNSTGYAQFPEGVSSGCPVDFDSFSLSRQPFLAGKCALVTGGALGIGRGIALELAREGVSVALHFVNENAEAESTCELINRNGGKALSVQGDFSTIEGVRETAEKAEGLLGKVDILINNAGITANVPFMEVTPEFYRKLFAVNLDSMFFLTQQVAKGMIERESGTIINLASPHSFRSANEHSVYAMTKGAIVNFTRNIAQELAPYHIRVNGISPGWCFGETHQRMMGNGSLTEAAAKIPAGHISNPTTIGRAAVHLCMPDFTYAIGQTLMIDGGMTNILSLGDGKFDAPQTIRWGTSYLTPEE